MKMLPCVIGDLVEKIRREFECLSEVLDERGRRVWAAVEAEGLGTEHRCQRHESVAHHPALRQLKIYGSSRVLVEQVFQDGF